MLAVPALPKRIPTDLPLADLFNLPVEQREELFAFIMENTFDGLVLLDAKGRVSYLNAPMERICGWQREEVRGRRVWEVFHDQREWTWHRWLLRESSKGTPQIFDVTAVRKDGQRRLWRVRANPFVTSSQQFFGTIAVCSDITEGTRLSRANTLLHERIAAEVNLDTIVGSSPAMQKVTEQIRVVAPTDATVLILGESGTGKELVARAIHEGSRRKDGLLVRVNCAAIPRELFESEFFGHARGAFTGAIKERVGRFELADGGTLFLDEVGEIPLDLQSKLLRVLQEGTFERVGEERTRRVNVRVIAATNQDLLVQSRGGRFRLDLYYRLSVFPIENPPLRERPEDVPTLAEFFLSRLALKIDVRPVPRLNRQHASTLSKYPWPGNVRELGNVIERALILASARGGRLEFDLPPVAAPAKPNFTSGSGSTLSTNGPALTQPESLQYQTVLNALQATHWRIHGPHGAAARLGINAFTLTSRLKRLGLQRHGQVHQAFVQSPPQ